MSEYTTPCNRNTIKTVCTTSHMYLLWLLLMTITTNICASKLITKDEFKTKTLEVVLFLDQSQQGSYTIASFDLCHTDEMVDSGREKEGRQTAFTKCCSCYNCPLVSKNVESWCISTNNKWNTGGLCH